MGCQLLTSTLKTALCDLCNGNQFVCKLTHCGVDERDKVYSISLEAVTCFSNSSSLPQKAVQSELWLQCDKKTEIMFRILSQVYLYTAIHTQILRLHKQRKNTNKWFSPPLEHKVPNIPCPVTLKLLEKNLHLFFNECVYKKPAERGTVKTVPDMVTSTFKPSRTSICWKRLRLMRG